MEAISSFHSLYSRFGKVDYYPFIHKDDFRSLIYNLLLQEFGPLKKYLLKNRPHSWMLCFPQKGTMRDNSRFSLLSSVCRSLDSSEWDTDYRCLFHTRDYESCFLDSGCRLHCWAGYTIKKRKKQQLLAIIPISTQPLILHHFYKKGPVTLHSWFF